MVSKSGVEVGRGVRQVLLRHAVLADGVEHREVSLLFGRFEVDEEVEHLVQHFGRARVGTVDLVDDHDDREAELEALPEDEPRLRQRAFGRVDQEQSAVGHEQGALDLATEVGVAGGVDDVDLRPLPANARVLREDRDPALFFEVVGVHHALDERFVLAERPRLAEHVIDQRGLTVVDVCDDRDVTDRNRHEGRGYLARRNAPRNLAMR